MGDLKLSLELSNTSTRDWAVAAFPDVGSTIFLDARDASGQFLQPLDLPGTLGYSPLSSDDFVVLRPGETVTRDLTWGEWFRPLRRNSTVHVRFVYGVTEPFASPIWGGTITSNEVILHRLDDLVVDVSGDWGYAELGSLRGGLRLQRRPTLGSTETSGPSIRIVRGNSGSSVEVWPVYELTDLTRLVSINSVHEAWEYVRLRTRVDFYGLWDGPLLLELVPPDEERYQIYGDLGAYWWDAGKLQPPLARPVRGGFEIHRNLLGSLATRPNTRVVFRSVERVTYDGDYSFNIQRVYFTFSGTPILGFPMERSLSADAVRPPE